MAHTSKTLIIEHDGDVDIQVVFKRSGRLQSCRMVDSISGYGRIAYASPSRKDAAANLRRHLEMDFFPGRHVTLKVGFKIVAG